MQPISAEQFRQRLAGLASPEKRFTEDELEDMKGIAVRMVRALRDVFGASLDRKTVWERIANGITVAAAKSGGKTDKYLAEMLAYVKAEANQVVGSDALKAVKDTLETLTADQQRQFIRVCVEYRMLLCLEARESVQAEKNVNAMSNRKEVESA